LIARDASHDLEGGSASKICFDSCVVTKCSDPHDERKSNDPSVWSTTPDRIAAPELWTPLSSANRHLFMTHQKRVGDPSHGNTGDVTENVRYHTTFSNGKYARPFRIIAVVDVSPLFAESVPDEVQGSTHKQRC
jgi:hypothetical protein